MSHVYMNDTHRPLLEKGCESEGARVMSILYIREVVRKLRSCTTEASQTEYKRAS